MNIFIFLFLIFILLVSSLSKTLKSTQKYRYDWPEPSYTMLGRFKKAAITTDHGLCSEIGRDILIKGGNTIDSTIASLFCLGVTNPQSSGLGGGFIMTFYNKTTKSCKVIDARETAPDAATRDMYKGDEFLSKYGYKAIATPGEIYGYWIAFTKYGSGKVSWKDLVIPSIELARNGIPVSEYLGDVLKVKESHFRKLKSMKGWLNPKTNKVYEHGDVIKRLELANTLEMIANSNDPVDLFYHGEIADIMVKEIQENGGILTKKDLLKYKPVEYDTPLINDHFIDGLVLCGPPPPSSFTVTQLLVSIVGRLYENSTNRNLEYLYNSPRFYHDFIEASKFAYAQRTLLGDVDYVNSSKFLSQNLTTREYTDWVVSRFKDYAQESSYYGGILEGHKEDHGTSHVSCMDSEGNGASATSTVNRWFGAVEQSSLGFLYNDEMDDFSTPGEINGFGFAPSETNFIEPGKRPMSSMSPMVIYNKNTGNLKMVIGASGGSKIISAMAKPILRNLIFGETIKQAIDAPTLHNQFTPDITQFEKPVPEKLRKDLEEMYGQKFKPTPGFEGIVQAIVVEDDGYVYANGDYRRKSMQHPEGL
uniref:Gamma-glutamyltranspeptidase 1 n=1 Tax=Parastrongyloides trichosuri TaxID=131310 RepID=A0A0N4ZWH7_PARTI